MKKYSVTFDGRPVLVSIPPSACDGCGGNGCKHCKGTGEKK
jgi:hypothetical protein